MKTAFLIFPHQLFKDISILKSADEIYLIEESLFFNQYKFHKTKLVLHRASMKYYEDYLQSKNLIVHYISANQENCDIRRFLPDLVNKGITQIHYYDVADNWLEMRILNTCKSLNINSIEHVTPLFINSKVELKAYFENRKKYFQTDFYIQQRKKLKILLENTDKPIGGKWSYDAENRLKYPKNKTVPAVNFPKKNQHYKEAIEYVETHYSQNYGNISATFIYPTTHQQSEEWLEQFFENRFREFGDYEDAIVADQSILHHSVLTPMLNIGLLLPLQIVKAAIYFADKNQIPFNSLEGFIRQIIGWREFIRGVYLYKGTEERNGNFWAFTKPIPTSFYGGTTRMEPLDKTIKKVIDTGYCHHIERLMILGNFMALAEIHPNAVYQWFMEMFIDAYDWVMVPNIYGMSQFADGGLMATKPYISGSNYILKMSNYPKGDWCATWDGLFWHFMHTHRQFFLSNPRLGMLVKMYDKMSEEKKQAHENAALKFIKNMN
jgi:deoxyribodipyrimidine photolyase-related protein